jgi:hypothetical protein
MAAMQRVVVQLAIAAAVFLVLSLTIGDSCSPYTARP